MLRVTLWAWKWELAEKNGGIAHQQSISSPTHFRTCLSFACVCYKIESMRTLNAGPQGRSRRLCIYYACCADTASPPARVAAEASGHCFSLFGGCDCLAS